MKTERGRLDPPSAAPPTGERVDVLASGVGWRIEQILTGRLRAPVEDCLDHEEWVVVLAGGATLDVDGITEILEPGDWLRLPPGVPHAVVSSIPGTSWLALHLATVDGEPAR